jgi:ubiquinone/menaquinone biosynthesis C-methylase UbiE
LPESALRDDAGGPAGLTYKARTAYLDEAVVDSYEDHRFGGRYGQYVWRREQRGVGAMVALVGTARHVLDCPSGIGRWVPVLQRLRPEVIVEADVSPTMLAASQARWQGRLPSVEVDATDLPFPDSSFDLVFCHALTKHLPAELQARVLAEFARVSSRHVVCSFSVDRGLPGMLRRVRELRRDGLSRAVSPGWLEQAAADAKLRIVAQRACTTPVGLERSVLFVKGERG